MGKKKDIKIEDISTYRLCALLADDSLDSRAVDLDACNLNAHLLHARHQLAQQHDRDDGDVDKAPVDGVLAAQRDGLCQQVAAALCLCKW